MFKKMIQFFLGAPVGHTSEADKFLSEIRAKNSHPSASQKATIDKHNAVFARRDGVVDCKIPADF